MERFDVRNYYAEAHKSKANRGMIFQIEYIAEHSKIYAANHTLWPLPRARMRRVTYTLTKQIVGEDEGEPNSKNN